jgi:hypothetical protein
VFFVDPISDSNLPPTQSRLSLERDWLARLDLGLVMSIEHLPHDKQPRLDRFRHAEFADNVLPLHRGRRVPEVVEPQHRRDEFFAALSPLLEEVAGLQEDEAPYQESNDFLLLLEENARLRKLAVQLSNLLGDLPEREAR